MSQDNLVKMECTVCKSIFHYTRKNKKILKERLELSKHCEKCKKHTPHKETK
jgi:large subunit ribosomal protein L33